MSHFLNILYTLIHFLDNIFIILISKNLQYDIIKYNITPSYTFIIIRIIYIYIYNNNNIYIDQIRIHTYEINRNFLFPMDY